MATRQLYTFDKLSDADLVIDAEYEGGTAGSTADDPLQRLLPVGNQGGFRYRGSPTKGVKLVVLYTSGETATGRTASTRRPASSFTTATTVLRAAFSTRRHGRAT